VSENDEFQVEVAVGRAVWPFLDYVKTRTGNKVFEIAPRSWDKGKAVQWLLGNMTSEALGVPAVPLYIGDDATDEDAFKTIGNRGVTAVVGGNHASAARYYIENTEEVYVFLKRVLHLRRLWGSVSCSASRHR
jgi:trehalose 6-phosphate phosphatase